MAKKIKHFILACLLAFYKTLFSNFSGRQCRFEPTCSEYAKQSFEEHGLIRGFILTIKRLVKCQPFYKRKEPYIFDPVHKKHM